MSAEPPNSGQIYYAVMDDRGVLKLTGTIRHPLSLRLTQAAWRLFSRAGIRSVIVDLQEARFIDSTCLGLLARVAMRSLELGFGPPLFVSTDKEVTRLLQTTGFGRAFVLIDNPLEPAACLTNAEPLAGVCPRPNPSVVLDAHRALCELNEKNRHLFQSVIEVLEAEVAQDEGSRVSRV